jgi:hypothetical protein
MLPNRLVSAAISEAPSNITIRRKDLGRLIATELRSKLYYCVRLFIVVMIWRLRKQADAFEALLAL